jgi:hypothetical protein
MHAIKGGEHPWKSSCHVDVNLAFEINLSWVLQIN